MLPTQTAVRIVIADDHSLFRRGFVDLMKGYENVEVIGEAENGEDLVQTVLEKKPDLVITDIRMPVMDGFEASKRIMQAYPHLGIIALSMCDHDETIIKSFQAGMRGFLLKNSAEKEILTAVDVVSRHGTHWCSHVSNKLFPRAVQANFETKPLLLFTQKELTIIELICKQYSSKEIGVELDLATRSVESYRERIQKKIGAKNMVGVALYAIKNGLYQI